MYSLLIRLWRLFCSMCYLLVQQIYCATIGSFCPVQVLLRLDGENNLVCSLSERQYSEFFLAKLRNHTCLFVFALFNCHWIFPPAPPPPPFFPKIDSVFSIHVQKGLRSSPKPCYLSALTAFWIFLFISYNCNWAYKFRLLNSLGLIFLNLICSFVNKYYPVLLINYVFSLHI